MSELSNVLTLSDPILIIIMMLVGYLATDHLKLHKCIQLPLQKVHYVFIVSTLVAVSWTLTAKVSWDTAFVSYLVANITYSHLIKQIISKIKGNEQEN